MNEQEVRALVREVIARRSEASVGALDVHGPASPTGQPWRHHASHRLLPVPSGLDADGPCIIEPTVRCNHCGYCKSFGH